VQREKRQTKKQVLQNSIDQLKKGRVAIEALADFQFIFYASLFILSLFISFAGNRFRCGLANCKLQTAVKQ